MTRSHDTNPTYDNHKDIMLSVVDDYQIFFDDSFKDPIPQNYTKPIPANQLIIQEDYDKNIAVCIGEFRFIPSRSSYPQVRLSIAKKISQAHGGELSADNHPEGGAIFTLILPIE